MNKDKVLEFYHECMNMDLSKMLELITDTESEDEKNFYTELYNYVLRTRQKELISHGVY